MTLHRRLRLGDAILLVIGNVVGAGIFTTSGFLAGELPQPLGFIGVWILGGLLTLCGALTYAELAGMFPQAGGDYQFLKGTYGAWAGFLLGWVNFWIIIPGSIAALSLALVGYLNPFVGLQGIGSEKLLALLIITLFAGINYRGIRWGGTTQDFITLGALAILAVFTLGGLTLGRGNWQHFASASPDAFSPFRMLGSPMIAVIFTYSGWFASVYVGSEVLNPERNLPRSLIWGTLIITVLYTLMNITYLYALPLAELKGAVNVGQLAAGRLFSPFFAQILTLAIILAIASSINATLLAGSRIFYAMAEDRIFWSFCKRLHPQFRTPHWAILSQGVLSGVLVWAGTFDQLLSAVVLVMLLTSIATGGAHLVLRWKKPDRIRPYLTWGYPAVPVIFIFFYGWIGGQVLWAKPEVALTGLLLTASGLPFYFFWAHSRKEKNN